MKFYLITYFLIFLFFSFHCLGEGNQTNVIKKCNRFLNYNDTYEFEIQTLYPPSYEVNVTVSDIYWLDKEETTETGSYGALFKKYTLKVKEGYLNNVDLWDIITIREVAKRGPDGQTGVFDPTKNTLEGAPPEDRTTELICQFDVSPDDDAHKMNAPILENDISNVGLKRYILFGSEDCGIDRDIDYLRFTPENSSCKIFMSVGKNANLITSLEQNNEIIYSSTQACLSDTLYKIIDVNNLQSDVEAYIKIEFAQNADTYNTPYKIVLLDCCEISETEDWDSLGHSVSISQNNQGYFASAFCVFENIDSVMCFEAEADCGFAINFYDGKFDEMVNNITEELNDRHKHTRYKLNNLQGDGNSIAKIYFNDPYISSCSVKLSRIKPIILVHGIDASPREDGDLTSFGELGNDTQYFDIRPYKSHDFSWDSLFSITDRYVGNGRSENTLGHFIKAKTHTSGLKAIVVAHSAGCLITYYECQKHNESFKEHVDGIVFAAPPLFGSYMADTSLITRQFSIPIKRTSNKNLDLLSRGTEKNWERGTIDFNFSKVSVAAGRRQHITWDEVAISVFDSFKKLKRIKNPFNYFDIKNYIIYADILWDFIADAHEGLLERTIGRDFALHNSELYSRNISDSAVGTYSAYINLNNHFHGVELRSSYRIHSEVQLFKPENDPIYQAVKERTRMINNEE